MKRIPEPKTLFTRNDCMTKGGPIEGVPVSPDSKTGKMLVQRGYVYDKKKKDWIEPE